MTDAPRIAAHQALVDALRVLLSGISSAREAAIQDTNNLDTDLTALPVLFGAIRKARAALSLATEPK